jgi:hypothetical protein
MNDYLYFDTRLKSYDDCYEENGTLYLGSKTSNRFTTVYDKAKEIADKGGPTSSVEWLRIEPHLNPKVSAKDTCSIKCPFQTLRIVDREKLAAVKHHIPVSVFRKRVFLQLLQPQPAFIAAIDKKSLLLGLKQAAPGWFDALTLWKLYPAAFHRLTPAGVHSIAQSPQTAIQPVPQAALC